MRKWCGLFWATSLEKIIGGVTAIVSYRPQVDGMQQSTVPRCAILSVGSGLAPFSECALVRRLRFRHRLPQRQIGFRPAISAVRVPDDVGISHGKDSFCRIP